MKRLFFTMAVMVVLFFSQGANAQIALEHSFNVGYESIEVHYDGEINYYVRYTWITEDERFTTMEIILYNEDYSLYKTVSIAFPEYYEYYQISFNKNVFTNDNKVTFLICLRNRPLPTSDQQKYNLKLYDENGTELKDFGYARTFNNYYVHVTSDNKYRLSVFRSSNGYATDIYSLPGTGTATSVRSAQVENLKQLPYPNPANTVITLPYKLEQGETSVMRIYNIGGQLIETKQIDFVFDKILLNVSGYVKGVYFYEVKGVSSRFVVE